VGPLLDQGFQAEVEAHHLGRSPFQGLLVPKNLRVDPVNPLEKEGNGGHHREGQGVEGAAVGLQCRPDIRHLHEQ